MADKNKNNLWIVVIVAIIVAVISSLITVSLTGNVVKVPTSTATTQTDVYTKAEVDSKLSSFINSGNLFGKSIMLTEPISNKQTVINGQGIVAGNVNIQGLNGIGNAYACISSLGNVYRSATACK